MQAILLFSSKYQGATDSNSVAEFTPSSSRPAGIKMHKGKQIKQFWHGRSNAARPLLNKSCISGTSEHQQRSMTAKLMNKNNTRTCIRRPKGKLDHTVQHACNATDTVGESAMAQHIPKHHLMIVVQRFVISGQSLAA